VSVNIKRGRKEGKNFRLIWSEGAYRGGKKGRARSCKKNREKSFNRAASSSGGGGSLRGYLPSTNAGKEGRKGRRCQPKKKGKNTSQGTKNVSRHSDQVEAHEKEKKILTLRRGSGRESGDFA